MYTTSNQSFRFVDSAHPVGIVDASCIYLQKLHGSNILACRAENRLRKQQFHVGKIVIQRSGSFTRESNTRRIVTMTCIKWSAPWGFTLYSACTMAQYYSSTMLPKPCGFAWQQLGQAFTISWFPTQTYILYSAGQSRSEISMYKAMAKSSNCTT